MVCLFARYCSTNRISSSGGISERASASSIFAFAHLSSCYCHLSQFYLLSLEILEVLRFITQRIVLRDSF